MFTTDRKSSYKLPPTTIRDKLVSQEARRNKALAEQKRRRAQRIDSARQLDLFAGLNLGASDDEYDNDKNENDIEPEEAENGPVPVPGSVAHYAAMLRAGDVEVSDVRRDVLQPEPVASSSKTGLAHPFPSPPPLTQLASTTIAEALDSVDAKVQPTSKKKRGKNNSKRRANKASKWADRCMYAELLEMCADEPWSRGDIDGIYNNEFGDYERVDGLPRDLETGWVAVAPVPVGKRCLAVTQQSAGVAGVVPNTTLRSRLLGKSLLARFPSALPPLTVLDCILDANWRENGILHVLDVVRWKGQDVGDCEAGFRFWWRDTRLAELTQTPPPSFHFVASTSSPSTSSSTNTQNYCFPYPTTFVSVPYHTDTSLTALNSQIIPSARACRMIQLQMPSTGILIDAAAVDSGVIRDEIEGDMEVEASLSSHSKTLRLQPATFKAQMPAPTARVQPDGMLLYVAEASYEPGTSPLSSWVPICLDAAAHGVKPEVVAQGINPEEGRQEGPLETFQRLVRRRLERRAGGHVIPPHLGASTGNESGGTADIEMEL